jgi:solute carrier family 9 (sodium/hydrogen exchanger), member 6/7
MSKSLYDSELIEMSQDERKTHLHHVDSLNILAFTILLILIILTIWLFKHKRLPYIHETSLALIYGLIFGIIIKYGLPRRAKPAIHLRLTNFNLSSIHDIIYLQVGNSSDTFIYNYKYPIKNMKQNSEYVDRALFDPEIFFNILLPPIIFHAGYSMKRRQFFRNFGSILTFALIGTALSCLFIGSFMYFSVSLFSSIQSYFSFTDCFFFGAIISATDPVTVLAIFNDAKIDDNLYALVFGESVLNDAVSIILAQAIERYSGVNSSGTLTPYQFLDIIADFLLAFIGSFGIGASMGCITALMTKYTYIRHFPHLETALFILMSYSTFLASEALGLTGIVACLFCGIFQAHYTYNNLSKESQSQTKQFFHLLDFLSENFIFIYIGVTMLTFSNHQWEFKFILTALVCLLLFFVFK